MRARGAAVPLLLLVALAAAGQGAVVIPSPPAAHTGGGRTTLPLLPLLLPTPPLAAGREVGGDGAAGGSWGAPLPVAVPTSRVRIVRVGDRPAWLVGRGGDGGVGQGGRRRWRGRAPSLAEMKTSAHVIQGTPVTARDAYSYIVDLSTSPTAVSTTRFCGGSLIAPDIVLTAGHCVLAVLGGGVDGGGGGRGGGGEAAAGEGAAQEGPSGNGGALSANSPADLAIYAVIGRHNLADEAEGPASAEGGAPPTWSAAVGEDLPPVATRPTGTASDAAPIRVLAAAIHPSYTGLGSSGDVALLLLERPSEARPVALAAASPLTGTVATVVGFGVMALGTLEGVGVNVAVLPRRLQATTLTVAERSFCESPGEGEGGGGTGADAIQGDGSSGEALIGRLPQGVLCTRPLVAGASACSGDSGSALVAPAAVEGGAAADAAGYARPDVLVGVVSFGDAACAARDAGVFTDVAGVREWVEEGVAELHATAAIAQMMARPPQTG